MLDGQDLRCFVAVAEELHFGRAAQRLHVVPATVTQRVRGLELDLGVRLFERTSRRVVLTSSGTRLLESARGVLASMSAVETLARSIAQGRAEEVRIGVAPNLGAFSARLLADLAARLPGLEAIGQSVWSSGAVDALRSGEISVAVIRTPLDDPAIASSPIGGYEDGFVAVPADHSLALQDRVSVRAFEGQPFLVPDREAAPVVHSRTTDFFRRHGVHPRWRYHRLQGFEQLAPFVASERAGMLVHSHLRRLDLPGVRILPLVEAGPHYDVVAAWRAEDRSAITAALSAPRG